MSAEKVKTEVKKASANAMKVKKVVEVGCYRQCPGKCGRCQSDGASGIIYDSKLSS